MVILADELLEGFFNSDLSASFQLEEVPGAYHASHARPDTLVGGLMSMVMTDGNKSRLNRLADGLGSALGRNAEWRKPAIGKDDPTHVTVDVKTRESLLSPKMLSDKRQRSPSINSQATVASQTSVSSFSQQDQRIREDADLIRFAQEAVMHRPAFKDDAINDSAEVEVGGVDAPPEDDAGVMDEVEAFLKANGADEKGLEGAAKQQAAGEHNGRMLPRRESD